MGDPSFAHCHVHTEFSILDGASRIEDVAAAAAKDGQPAVGITDHGNMYGVLPFYAACQKAGVTPIIGTEAYMAYERRDERIAVRGATVDDTGGEGDGGKKAYYHLTLLAETNKGYANLIKLSSRAFLEGYYRKPKCLLPDQEIVTREGMKRIADIQVGDEVLTHRGRFRPVTQTMVRQHHGELSGIRLAGRYGRITWMTGEHPVLVRDRTDRRSWVHASDVTAGRSVQREEAAAWSSWVCMPKLAPSEQPLTQLSTVDYSGPWKPSVSRPGQFEKGAARAGIGPTRHYTPFPDTIHLDDEFGYFLGLYIAEGHISAPSDARWSFHEDETDLIDRCRNMAEKLTGQSELLRCSGPPGYRSAEVRCGSAVLARLLVELCGKAAADKHLPHFTFTAPKEFQEGLVAGVLDGNGSRCPDRTTLVQTSEMLAWQLRTLRASLAGDFASVRELRQPDPAHHTHYRSHYPPSSGGPPLRSTQEDDEYVYKPVAQIETRPYSGPVHNIEVATDHSYVSDFAIHNCDWDMLAEHAEGLIATTGCLGGHVLQSLLNGNFTEAMGKAARLQDIFGKDNLFVEIQDHGIPEQHRTNPQLVEIAKRIGAPLIATNDSHYTRPEDADAHDALLCVQTKATIDQANRFRFSGSGHYLKTAAEMRHLFAELPEACDSTLWIAQRANVTIELGKPKLPNFPLPEGFSTDGDYLHHLTFEGAKERWGDALPDAVTERLAYELRVIEDMGYSAYFLIVWDLIRYARENGIRVGPGRGSAAGCAVAYSLRITELDPIRYDLIFERFLNPSRASMPDIDMDFDSRYRDEMIRYAAQRYGRDHVAQIITFGTIKARASVRDAARVLGYPYSVGDRLAKAMPPMVMGRDTPLWACVAEEAPLGYEDGWKIAADLRKMIEEDADVARVATVAKGLEGMRRQDGIHAAAVVITKDPLTEYLPVQRKPDPSGNPEDAPVVTQYEMHGVEELGLLKMDFLGLRNLDVITDTVNLIKDTRTIDVDIDHVDLEDGPTFELLQRGDSVGVFQLEGGAMRTLMQRLRPTGFEDVCALIALYRPGPMAANMHFDYADRKNDKQPVEYLHPDAEGVLSDTFGLMIYQEKLMRVAQQFAGYSLAEADNLRRACGKKIREVMKAEREKFVDSCVNNGYTKDIGEKWFDIIEPFADYAFAKAHAYGYGLVAYQTAYLKANFPTEYLAALLTSVRENLDKAGIYLADCRARQITVSVPDVNRSAANFTPVVAEDATRTILFGIAAVRNVGAAVAESIVTEREARGPFSDFYDFCERVPISSLNKQPMEALIRAGAFDSLGHTRKGLLSVHEVIVSQIVARRRERDQGVLSLFGGMDGSAPVFEQQQTIPDWEFEKKERLAHEKEMLGLYVSDHPILGLSAALRRATDAALSEVEELPEGTMRTFGGVITGLQLKWTRRGEQMAVFNLEDLERSVEVTVFPKGMLQYGHVVADDAVVTLRARVDRRDDAPKLMATEITAFAGAPSGTEPLRIRIPINALSDDALGSLKQVLASHHGAVPVHLYLAGGKAFRLPAEYGVDTGNGVVAQLRITVPGIEILAEAPEAQTLAR